MISYEIQIDGILSERWANGSFGELALSYKPGKVTTIQVCVPDSAALRGLVNHLWDFNLSILSIRKLQLEHDQTSREDHDEN